MKAHRFVVIGFEGRGERRRVHVFDRAHGRSVPVFAQGNRLMVWDRHHPTLREVAMEALD